MVEVMVGVSCDPLVPVAILVREGVYVIVGPGVREGVCVRSMITSPEVAVREPGFRMMIGSVPLPAAVWIAEEGVLVLVASPLGEDPEPEEEPC